MEKFIVARVKHLKMNDAHIYTIVASKSGVKYVFRDGVEGFDTKQRIKYLVEKFGEPSDPKGWISLVTKNSPLFFFDIYTYDEDSKVTQAELIKDEREALSRSALATKPAVSYERMSAASDYMDSPKDSEAQLDAEKRVIAAAIKEAGTEDLNPWLDEWLKTGKYNPKTFNGLILRRD